jgi:hypothetical protein
MDGPLVVVWLGLSVAVGILASRYGRYGFWWTVISLLLSPLVGVALVLALGRVWRVLDPAAREIAVTSQAHNAAMLAIAKGPGATVWHGANRLALTVTNETSLEGALPAMMAATQRPA